MKTFLKYSLLAGLLIFAGGAANAQSDLKAKQAKLPSNRPAPDKAVLARRIEAMRQAAREEEERNQRAEQERAKNQKPAAVINKQ